mmetsp:Transcript_82465/g.145524  ORF Transcript_82465/g.145524 Transcript_82465/m.145524 type:complete len:84 (-) Transcript_82465:963-1214(-)
MLLYGKSVTMKKKRPIKFRTIATPYGQDDSHINPSRRQRKLPLGKHKQESSARIMPQSIVVSHTKAYKAENAMMASQHQKKTG